MSKADVIEVEGVVVEKLPNASTTCLFSSSTLNMAFGSFSTTSSE